MKKKNIYIYIYEVIHNIKKHHHAHMMCKDRLTTLSLMIRLTTPLYKFDPSSVNIEGVHVLTHSNSKLFSIEVYSWLPPHYLNVTTWLSPL